MGVFTGVLRRDLRRVLIGVFTGAFAIVLPSVLVLTGLFTGVCADVLRAAFTRDHDGLLHSNTTIKWEHP